MTLLRLLLAALLAIAAPSGATADPQIPNFWDLKERFPKPQLGNLQRLRFLTTVDFPPFNFIDANGDLTGFHVDLVRRICAELEVTPVCQIQAVPWNELESTLANGGGEAIVAGLAITAETRGKYAFSRPYLRFPARFVMPKSTAVTEPLAAKLDGKRIGVLKDSAHERMLRSFFPKVQPVVYGRQQWLYGDLREGKLDGVFGDGMRLSFWLAGNDSAGCCRFAGGPYMAPNQLGHGLAIAVPHDNPQLADAFNYALRELQANGGFAELYLRYFPVSFY